MKPKYNGIMAACFFTGSIALSIIYAINMPRSAPELKYDMKPNRLSGIYIPSSAVLKKMEFLLKHMPEIASRQKPDSAPVNLSILGYRPVSNNTFDGTQGTSNKRLRSLEADYKITLAFSSDKNSFCIINGRLYSPGDMLPGGARVVKIESKQVLIRKLGSDIWISLSRSSEQPEKQRKEVSNTTP